MSKRRFLPDRDIVRYRYDSSIRVLETGTQLVPSHRLGERMNPVIRYAVNQLLAKAKLDEK